MPYILGFGLLIHIGILHPCLIGSHLFLTEQMALESSLTLTNIRHIANLQTLRDEVDASGTNKGS